MFVFSFIFVSEKHFNKTSFFIFLPLSGTDFKTLCAYFFEAKITTGLTNQSITFRFDAQKSIILPTISIMSGKTKIKINQHPITMIHLVLNDLCRPAGEVFRARLHFQGLILYLDGFVAFTRAGADEKRQTTFFGVVRAVLFDDLRVEHYRVCRNSSALVEKGDDALANTDHIRRHADA